RTPATRPRRQQRRRLQSSGSACALLLAGRRPGGEHTARSAPAHGICLVAAAGSAEPAAYRTHSAVEGPARCAPGRRCDRSRTAGGKLVLEGQEIEEVEHAVAGEVGPENSRGEKVLKGEEVEE